MRSVRLTKRERRSANMGKTKYSEFDEINELQTKIMRFIILWVHEKKIPVPHQEVVRQMTAEGVHDFTTCNALNSLLRKGYIRRAYTTSNRTFYVQLRNL